MSNYRILRIAGLHYKSVKKALPPSFTESSYEEQQKILFENGYVYSDSFSRAMRSLGHSAEEVVYDFEEMQIQWAKEQGLTYSKDAMTEILLAQIEKMRPDILFFQDIYSLNYEIRKGLKDRFPFLKLIVLFRGFPGDSPQLYKEFSTADLLLLGSPRLIQKCKNLGLQPHLVYHYFDERILRKVQEKDQEAEKCPFSFIGSSGFGYGIEYLERYQFLKTLLKNTALQAWLDEPLEGKQEATFPKKGLRYVAKNLFSLFPKSWVQNLNENGTFPLLRGVFQELIVGESIPQKPLSTVCPGKCHAPLFGIEMYRQLYHSQLTFNKHTTTAKTNVDNIRLFQATGMGSCLLTDRGDNLSDLFEEDREVIAYSSLEECLEKAKYLIEHVGISQEVAKKGQERTLKDHTALKRCQQMDLLIQKALV